MDGGINLFAYVQNNPVNFIDPYGLTFQDAFNGAIFGFKASYVVARETAKMVAVDVALATLNYVPLPPAISFWSGRGMEAWVIHNNFVGVEQTARKISSEIQSIRDEIFPIPPPPVPDSFWGTGSTSMCF